MGHEGMNEHFCLRIRRRRGMRDDTNEWGTKEWGQRNVTRGEQQGGGRGEGELER